MNLRFVEAFYWSATLKSVSRTAEKLFLTQSAVSARIAALEEELGVLLLDRSKRQFQLTSAGARFLIYAEKLLDLQREVRAAVGSSEQIDSRLRVGAIESVLHSWLVPWLEHLRAHDAELQLELTVETTPVLLDQISRGMQDIVFAALPAGGEGLRASALTEMTMRYVARADLFRKRKYSLQELAKQQLLTFQRGSQPHNALLDSLKSVGAEPQRIHNISSVSAMLQLVRAGFGVATLPRAAAEPIVKTLGLKCLTVQPELAALPIHMSFREDPSKKAIAAAALSARSFVKNFR